MRDKMKKRMAAVVAACLAVAVNAAWDPGEPVTTYWFGPGCPGTNSISLPMTDAWARQLKEGGFNTVWARTPEELDIAARHGLRVIYSVDPRTEWAKIDLDDPAQKAALTERINCVKNHPSLYLYEHYDEAAADLFEGLARVKDYIHELDPNHPCWHNLLPTYANHKQLGVGGKGGEPLRYGFGSEKIAAYWEHVRLFCEMYQPELITYDYYQFKTNGDKTEYFLNLGIIQQNAAARGVPFWNGLQACTWVPGELASPKSPRVPNVDEMRYLAHTTAAYGADGLYWYVYGRADHVGTIAAPDGTVGEKYEGVKKINREFIAFSRVLRGLRFQGAYMQGLHSPGTTPYDAQALLKITPKTPYAECKALQRLEDTTLITRFADAKGRPYLMVVNCDYKKDRTLHVNAPFAAEIFDPASGQWSSSGTAFDLALPRGGGVIVRRASMADSAFGVTRTEALREKLASGDRDYVFVVMHRGDWRNFPENSKGAILSSIRLGADIVELDVHMTKDGRFILNHDKTLDRTTTGQGLVQDLTLAEIKQFKMRDKDGQPTDYDVLTLEEALELTRGKALINIDKFTLHPKEILDAVAAVGALKEVLVKSTLPIEMAKELFGPYWAKVESGELLYMPVSHISTKGYRTFGEGIVPGYLAAEPRRSSMYEVCFNNPDDVPEAIAAIKAAPGRPRIWVNTLWDSISGKHSDRAALLDPDANWGWWLERGATMLQTDYAAEMIVYLMQKGRRNF